MNITQESPHRQPQSPEIGLIQMLHRGHDQIPICKRNDAGEFQDLFTLPAWDASHFFPQISNLLDRDAYFSVNGYWAPPTRNTLRMKSEHCVTTVRNTQQSLLRPMRQRRKEYIQRINAVHCDMDCHTVGMTPGRVIGDLIDMQDAGELPRVSVIEKSGRGVWAFWFIRDRLHEDRGQKATPWAIQMAEQLNRTVQERLSRLGADRQCVDLSRVTRVPGSLNTKSGTRVEYWVNSDESGNVATYRLDDLIEFFGLEFRNSRNKEGAVKCPIPKGLDPKQGARIRWAKEVERFRKLWAHRRVFQEGVRSAAVYLHLTFLRLHQWYSGISNQDVADEMKRLFESLEVVRGCKVTEQGTEGKSRTYTHSDFKRQLKAKQSDALPSHKQIADLLKITPEEAVLTGWPAAGVDPALSRREKQNLRRRLLRKWYVENGEAWPAYREIVDRLQHTDPRLKCAHRTIGDDVRAIMRTPVDGLCNSKANRGESPSA